MTGFNLIFYSWSIGPCQNYTHTVGRAELKCDAPACRHGCTCRAALSVLSNHVFDRTWNLGPALRVIFVGEAYRSANSCNLPQTALSGRWIAALVERHTHRVPTGIGQYITSSDALGWRLVDSQRNTVTRSPVTPRKIPIRDEDSDAHMPYNLYRCIMNGLLRSWRRTLKKNMI